MILILSKLELELLKEIISETNVKSSGISNIADKVDSAIDETTLTAKTHVADNIIIPFIGNPSVGTKRFYSELEIASIKRHSMPFPPPAEFVEDDDIGYRYTGDFVPRSCRYSYSRSNSSIYGMLKSTTLVCSKCRKQLQEEFFHNTCNIERAEYLCESCFPLIMDKEYGYSNWELIGNVEKVDKEDPTCIEGDHPYVVRDNVDSSWKPIGWDRVTVKCSKDFNNLIDKIIERGQKNYDDIK